jgi:CheY-like chemotaxis protein
MENLVKGKILIVEDEKSMREVLGILLEGEGYDVTLAAGGIDGINLLNKDIFDMIITDINMPKVNCCQQIELSGYRANKLSGLHLLDIRQLFCLC